MIKVFQWTVKDRHAHDVENTVGPIMFGKESTIQSIWNGENPNVEYRHVATIEQGSMEDAFRLTNSIDEAWYESKEISVEPEAKRGCRSTSVGDVMQDSDGSIHFVASFGFQKLNVEPKRPANKL